ncbi:MAG: transcriptional regulator, TetR family [Verrucomicrobiales bacterium]|nr:transcriptional regulator, TetR family [Verrucomicrobiales bacterium]
MSAENIQLDSEQALTRRNLLEAASEVFAEIGFRAATVREICQRAGANIAAVNYHFGDKAKLYVEVLRRSQEQAFQKYPPDYGIKPGASAEEKLKAFVRSFLLRIFDEGTTAHHGKMMSREMIEPTGALDALVEEKIRPTAMQLAQIVRELIGPGVDDEKVRLCAMSIVSQCVFHHHCRPVVIRLFPNQKFTTEDVERLAEHITQFSLGALKGVKA